MSQPGPYHYILLYTFTGGQGIFDILLPRPILTNADRQSLIRMIEDRHNISGVDVYEWRFVGVEGA